MPVREQVLMGSTEFRAYSRRKKVKKEELCEKKAPVQDQVADFSSLKSGQCPSADDEAAKRLLSLELDVAEALADFWRMAHQQPRPFGFLQWSCKRKRTASRNNDLMAPCIQPKEDPEDALSTVKKKRSSCALGRDLCASDRDEIDSVQCSKESSSLFDSRAQSPSSPLPSLQLPCRNFLDSGNPDVKLAFQQVVPLAPCLLTVKTEIEDIHSEHLVSGPHQGPVRQQPKVHKPLELKVAVKAESVDEHGATCLEELEVKPLTGEPCKVLSPALSKKPKSALSEVEKEARKLRRIQANRESARQTIRKKQVLCEELTTKASHLVLENEDMKQKRDLLLQQFFFLKGQNQNLKQQLETKSSGGVALDPVDLPLKMPSDPASVPALQAPSLPYPGPPPHAFFWAMAAAAAANQAFTVNKQEACDASSAAQLNKASLAIPGLQLHNQNSVLDVLGRSASHSSGGDDTPTLTELPQKGRSLPVGVCAKLRALPTEETHRDPSTEACHPAEEFSSGNLIERSACELSGQAGSLLPQPTVAGKSESSFLTGIAVNTKGMDYVMGLHSVQGPACSYMYNGNVIGYYKGIPHVNAIQGRNHYTAMVAAEARRRRKELTRSKFLRSRANKPAAARPQQ